MTRANPFVDLTDFAPTPKQPVKPGEKAQIDRLAEESGFPSRQPATPPTPAPQPRGRRYTTGRNRQINIKATAETIERLYRLADRRHVPLGELLERAVELLEKEGS